jgi:hypothetical protein
MGRPGKRDEGERAEAKPSSIQTFEELQSTWWVGVS